MGGRLAEAPHRSSARHRAPYRTQLLPRQVISGRDTADEDISTHLLNSQTLSSEALTGRGSHIGVQMSAHMDKQLTQ